MPASPSQRGRAQTPDTQAYGDGQVPLALQGRCWQKPAGLQYMPVLQLASPVHGCAHTIVSIGSAMHCVPGGHAIRMSQRVQTPPGRDTKQPPAVGGCS